VRFQEAVYASADDHQQFAYHLLAMLYRQLGVYVCESIVVRAMGERRVDVI